MLTLFLNGLQIILLTTYIFTSSINGYNICEYLSGVAYCGKDNIR